MPTAQEEAQAARAAEEAAAQAASTTTTETTPQAGGGKPEDTSAEIARLQAQIKEANKEAAGYRTKLRTFEEAEKTRKEAEMSEVEKAQARITELEQQAQQANEKVLASEIKSAAATLGFADPADAAKFIDRAQLKEDMSNLADLLKDVLKSKPYLAKDPKAIPATGAANPPAPVEKADAKAKEEQVKTLFPATRGRV